MKYWDSLTSLVNKLANRRNPMAQNTITAQRISDSEARAIYRTGMGSKICRIKAGYALNDTLQFRSTEDETFYQSRLSKSIKKAARLTVGFGRAIVVMIEKGESLSEPKRTPFDPKRTRIEVFSGDMVTVGSVDIDLMSDRYMKPKTYTVRGAPIHHTRVVDFKYLEPPELDMGDYRYGGISEFELIRPQLIADEIVQRVVPAILEKNSVMFYKLHGFRENLQNGNTDAMVEYFTKMEDLRSIYGAGVIDATDEIEAVNQTLTNLSESDMITLRRLAMVTGIPMAILIGENVKGLNSTGDNEMATFQDMIETIQSEYLLDPICEVMAKFGRDAVEFKDNQGQTMTDRIDIESKVIENAVKLAAIGEDYVQYLQGHDLAKTDDIEDFFAPVDDGPTVIPSELPDGTNLDDLLSGGDEA